MLLPTRCGLWISLRLDPGAQPRPTLVSEAVALADRHKRCKGAAAEAEAPVSIASVDESPLSRLEGHLHCVSSAAWPVETSLYSGGWDHSVGLGGGWDQVGLVRWGVLTYVFRALFQDEDSALWAHVPPFDDGDVIWIALQVRRWDVATGINTDTYNGSKVISSVASSSGAPDVAAFGGSDRTLRVWDSRSRKGEGLAVQVGRTSLYHTRLPRPLTHWWCSAAPRPLPHLLLPLDFLNALLMLLASGH